MFISLWNYKNADSSIEKYTWFKTDMNQSNNDSNWDGRYDRTVYEPTKPMQPTVTNE